MSSPFFVWTVQRTGSTTLTTILSHLSSSDVKHEPFNVNREFAYRRNKDVLIQNLDNLRGQCFCFKHCWNVHRPMFNQLIFDFFIQDGYRLILLSRSNVLAMEISRQLAKQTGVWGKNTEKDHCSYIEQDFLPLDIIEITQSISSYVTRLNEYRLQLEQANINYFSLSYENIFETSMEQRFSLIRKLCNFLDIPSKNIEDKKTNLEDLLKDNKQNTFEVYKKIPNIDKILMKFPEYNIFG
jgi:LPS sulfotransferase NodH